MEIKIKKINPITNLQFAFEDYKTDDEIKFALINGVGLLVLDNLTH